MTASGSTSYSYGTAQTDQRGVMRRVVLWALAAYRGARADQDDDGPECPRVSLDGLEYARYGRHHFFQFDRHQGQHYAIYTAGNDGDVEEHFPGTWERQALYFAGWAARVDAEARGGRLPRSP